MNYTDIFCIIILTCILIYIFYLNQQELQEGFSFDSLNSFYLTKYQPVGDNDFIDAKFARDEHKLLTEYSFYVNDKIKTPPPIIITQTPMVITVPCTPCPDAVTSIDTSMGFDSEIGKGATTSPSSTNITTGAEDSTDYAETDITAESNQTDVTTAVTSAVKSAITNAITKMSNAIKTDATTKPVSNLLYYYSFERRTISDNTLINEATNVGDATINGATVSLSNAAVGAACMYFENTSKTNLQYIKCPDIITDNFANGMTISLWMNPNEPSSTNKANAYYTALSLGKSAENIYLGYKNDFLCFGMNGNDYYTNIKLPSKTWTHVVWTISLDGTNKTYVNSASGYSNSDSTDIIDSTSSNSTTSDGTSTSSSSNKLTTTYNPSATYPFYIGYNNPFTIDHFNGYLDDVRIYNRILSSSDALKLFNKQNVI